MKARSQKSAIINMTSYYSESPDENLPVMSSAKSFSDVFSQNLYYENQDMDILTVKHLPPKTDANLLGVDPKELVEGVFHDLGQQTPLGTNRISYGHQSHSLFRPFLLLKQNPFWFNSNTLLGKALGL